MLLNQISVFLENKPGTLQVMTQALAEAKVDMRALSLAETKDFGIARIIVNDVFEACSVLKDAGFVASLTPVVGVSIPDEPGGLNIILQILAANNINLEYMYAFLGGKETKHAYMILRVGDENAAAAALRTKGLDVIDQDTISDL